MPFQPLISTDGSIYVPTIVNPQVSSSLGRYMDLTSGLPALDHYSVGEYMVPNLAVLRPEDPAGWYMPGWNQHFGGVSGGLLKDLNTYLVNIQELQKVSRLVFDATVMPVLGIEGRRTAPSIEFSFDAALVAINAAQNDVIYSPYRSVLLVILEIDRVCTGIRAELSRTIKAVKRALAKRRRTVYCGLNWCKRTWFLLHGSHPPKGEIISSISPFVGCAQT
jgi:hypothetical protein